MSDDDILMRGGTEYDIAMYAHDVGKACMYPDYPCEICEARNKAKRNRLCNHTEPKKGGNMLASHTKEILERRKNEQPRR